MFTAPGLLLMKMIIIYLFNAPDAGNDALVQRDMMEDDIMDLETCFSYNFVDC